MRWLLTAIAIATLTTTTTARADKAMTVEKLFDAIAVSRDGKRLVLPLESVYDGAYLRKTRSVVVVDLADTTGTLLPLSYRDNEHADGGVDKAQERDRARAIDKVLADGGFTPLPLVAPGKELAPKLTVELAPGKGSFKVVAMRAKSPVGSATVRGRGTAEIAGAVLVPGPRPHAYVLVRWSTSNDGGVAQHDDDWVAIAIPK